MYTAGVDLIQDQPVKASYWNDYLGVDGSIDYFKTEADRLDDCSPSEEVTSGVGQTRDFDTAYENDSGTIRFVSVTVNTTTSTATAAAYSDAGANPSTLVSYQGLHYTYGKMGVLSFAVLPGNYYKVVKSTNTTLIHWVEWDLH